MKLKISASRPRDAFSFHQSTPTFAAFANNDGKNYPFGINRSKHMTEETNTPFTSTPESNLPGITGSEISPSAKENIESSKQHLREAGDALRANLETSKGHVKQAADDLRAAAEAKAHEFRAKAEVTAQEIRGRAEHAYSDARDRARTLQDDGEEYIRQNPSKSVLTALAAGFVLGLILRR